MWYQPARAAAAQVRKGSLGSWNLCARVSKIFGVPRKEVKTMMPGSAMSASDENGAGLVGDSGRPSSQSAACKRLRPKACVTPAGADRARPGIQHLSQTHSSALRAWLGALKVIPDSAPKPFRVLSTSPFIQTPAELGLVPCMTKRPDLAAWGHCICHTLADEPCPGPQICRNSMRGQNPRARSTPLVRNNHSTHATGASHPGGREALFDCNIPGPKAPLALTW